MTTANGRQEDDDRVSREAEENDATERDDDYAHYTPADSADYLDGPLPRYQGNPMWMDSENPDMPGIDINNLDNPMDPSARPVAPAAGTGVWAAQFGSGQRRFWFVPYDRLGDTPLYDRAAGILLRDLGAQVLLSALYLYPEANDPESQTGRRTFMLHLILRGAEQRNRLDDPLESQYERLTAAVMTELADRSKAHWPPLI